MTDQHSDPSLDEDLADWDAPGWASLGLSDEDVEVVVHLAMRPDAMLAERARDLWPHLASAEGVGRLMAAGERVNTAAIAATGHPSPVILMPGLEFDPSAPARRSGFARSADPM